MKIFKKEHEVTELALEYLDAAEHCVAMAEKCVLSYLAGDFAEAVKLRPLVRKLESKADELRRAIGDKLYSGAYLPLLRGDIFELIVSIDEVPNAAEACCSFFVSQKPGIPEELRGAFVDIVVDSFGIMRELHKATKEFFKPKGKVDSTRNHAREVGVQESVVDGKEWNLTLAIFDSSSIDLASKLHLKRALDRIVHISDCAEDSAEQLGLVAVKSVV